MSELQRGKQKLVVCDQGWLLDTVNDFDVDDAYFCNMRSVFMIYDVVESSFDVEFNKVI